MKKVAHKNKKAQSTNVPKVRIGFDIGGTFTDVAMVVEDSGAVFCAKIPSTPDDPAQAAFKGIEEVLRQGDAKPSQVSYLVHGSTVSANAVLQNKGARTALITTAGFRDVLEIGRVSRGALGEGIEDVLYNIRYVKPVPIVPRQLRFEVPERTNARGEVVKALDETAVVHSIAKMRALGVESVAVCFLHSYVNPTHEKRVKELLSQHYPEVWSSLSSEIFPQYREYERFSTTALNAYVMPPLNRYLTRLETGLSARGIDVPLFVMQATGGVTSAALARINSVHTALSGFVGGVIGGAYLAQLAGFRNVITLDIGGTSTDISTIRDGSPEITSDGRLGEYPVQIPIISVRTIGAGGGSIARIGSDGFLKVGPQSSGADPGPACYGRNGNDPTVSDANVLLGRLNPKHLLDGLLPLQADLSSAAIQKNIARPLDLKDEVAARGIVSVQTANIVRAIRANTVERGLDPRDSVLVAFGGAGPLHAEEIAYDLDIPKVIIPPYAGVISALGLLAADIRQEHTRTLIGPVTDTNLGELRCVFRQLECDAERELIRGKIPLTHVRYLRSLGLRYVGQGYEIKTPIEQKTISRAAFSAAIATFHKRHRELYRHSSPDEPVELVSISLTVIVPVTRPQLRRSKVSRSASRPYHIGTRGIVGEGRRSAQYKIYRREALTAGHVVRGPAIIEQFDSTTVISARSSAKVDMLGNLVITAVNSRK